MEIDQNSPPLENQNENPPPLENQNENPPNATKNPSNETAEKNMDQIYQEVLKKKTLAFIQTSQLPQFYEYCDNLKDKLIDEERYLDARDADLLMGSIVEELSYRKDNNPQQTSAPTNEQENQEGNPIKIEDANTNQLIQGLDKKIQQQEETAKQKIQALQQKQIEDLKKFEKEWSDVMPEKYRRPSKRLLLMREQAHTLAVAGKYQEANSRQMAANALMQEEFESAKMRLNRDYNDAKKKFLKKQNDELELLQTTQKQQHDLLLTKKQDLQESINKRKAVLEKKAKSKPQQSTNSQSQLNNTSSIPSRNRPVKKTSNAQSDPFKLPPLKAPNRATNTRKNQNGITPPKTNATTEQPTSNTTARPEEQKEENVEVPNTVEEEEEPKEQPIEGGTAD